jgi:hypothetical protein
MQTKILKKKQLEVLELIRRMGGFPSFRLGGGTAVALYLGHRRSVDFDFFSKQSFETGDLKKALKATLKFKAVREQKGSLVGTARGVSLSFFHFEYPIIGTSSASPWGFSLLSLKDLAAMKLEAIAGRGSRKDFVDLYWITREHLSLADAFKCFSRKFGKAGFDSYHRFRSLTYFEEADREPMPDMLEKAEWNDMKAYFIRETKKLWGKKIP